MHDRDEARKVFEGKNFMTPDIIEYGWVSHDVAYELSSGSGFNPGTTIYGVTFRNKWDTGRSLDYSQMAESLEAGYAYVEEIREELAHGN